MRGSKERRVSEGIEGEEESEGIEGEESDGERPVTLWM